MAPKKSSRPSILKKPPRPSQGRRLFEKNVRFDKLAKRHDGQRIKTYLLNEFMRYVLELSINDIVHTLVEKRNLFGLHILLNELEDLITRCETSPKGYALISPGGCRNSAGSITKAHLPYLRKYIPYLKNLIKRVKEANPSQKDDYLKAKKPKSFRMKLQENF